MVGSFLNVVIHRLPKILERDWDGQAADLLEQKHFADAANKLRGPELKATLQPGNAGIRLPEVRPCHSRP